MPDNTCNALVLGITGSIASGKSEVGRILTENGFLVCDTDQVAHELLKKGTAVYDQVVGHFGSKILSDENNEITRSILGRIIFESSEDRDALNRMVHPTVRSYLETWISERRSKAQNAAVLVPLMFESGMNTLNWDAVICVSSSEELIVKRLEWRGLKKEDSILRIRSQWSSEMKEKEADLVIPNYGSLEELGEATRDVVGKLLLER